MRRERAGLVFECAERHTTGTTESVCARLVRSSRVARLCVACGCGSVAETGVQSPVHTLEVWSPSRDSGLIQFTKDSKSWKR